MTGRQVARLLRVTYKTVVELAKSRRLKAVIMDGSKPCGNRYYITQEWLQDYIDSLNPDLSPDDRSLTFSK